MITIYCLDCSDKRANPVATGSLLCNECQNEMFDRINSKYKSKESKDMRKTNIERVEELMAKGMKAPEIAEETGIKINSVYQNMSIVRKRKNESKKRDPQSKKKTIREYSAQDNESEIIKKLKEENLQLIADWKRLSGQHTDLKKEFKQLEEDHVKLSVNNVGLDKYNDLTTSYDRLKLEKEKLETKIWDLEKTKLQLKDDYQQLLNERNNKITELQKRFDNEYKMHQVLLEYLMLKREVV